MIFVNNWSQPLELAGAATSASLELPDGEYLLTASRNGEYEIIAATVTGGEAALMRGREGTEAQDWPAGSVIYCALTAGTIAGLFSTIAALTERVAALEPPPALQEFPVELTVGAGGEAPGLNGVLGYISWHNIGSCDPNSVEIIGTGLAQIIELAIYPGTMEEEVLPVLNITLGAALGQSTIVLDLPEIGELTGDDASYYSQAEEEAETTWGWEIPSGSWAENDVINLVIKIAL